MCSALRNSLHHSGTLRFLLPSGEIWTFYTWPLGVTSATSLPPSIHPLIRPWKRGLLSVVLCAIHLAGGYELGILMWAWCCAAAWRGISSEVRLEHFKMNTEFCWPSSPTCMHAMSKSKKNPIINGIRPRWGFRLSDFHFLSGSVAPPKNPLLQPFFLPSCYHGEFALILRRSLPGVVQFLENGNWLNFNLCINQESTDSFIDLSETERSFENTEKFSIQCIPNNLRSVNGAKRTSK